MMEDVRVKMLLVASLLALLLLPRGHFRAIMGMTKVTLLDTATFPARVILTEPHFDPPV